MEIPVFNVLVLVAFGLMVVISGGVGYLTFAEWRDRRRRDRDSRGDRPVPGSTNKANKVDSPPSAGMARKTSKNKNKAKK